MLVLAVDTSGRNGSVALARGDAESFALLELRELAGGMYSAELVPQIGEMLKAQQLQKTDIDLFSVCSGPGSFTGLRVGLSALKALAEVLQKPLVATTVLEAISINAAQSAESMENRTVVAALDAQRGEVFSGEYELAGSIPKRLCESLSSLNDFTVWLGARSPVPAVFSPDAALAVKVRESGTPVFNIARPTADTYARIGLQKFAGGSTVAPEELDADYIRRSDADIFSNPKK